MGNTILQHLVRAKSGLMLLEDFEAVDFMSDQGWTLNNGVPTTSTSIFFSGVKSLAMDLTYPQIQRSFSTPFRWSAGYFFDDATQTVTTFKPFLQWISTAPAGTWGLGVANATSTGFYTKIVNGVQTATAVARTNGWHKFELGYDGSDVVLSIDGVVVNTSATAGLNFNIVKVGLQTFVGATAFGFFDLIQVTTSKIITFTGLPFITGAPAGASGTLYDAAGAILAGPTVTTGTYTVDVTALVPQQPFLGSFASSKADGQRPLFRSPVLTFSAGDIWVYNNFDLGRRVPSFKKPRATNRADIESSAGVNQSLFYFSRDVVGLTLSDLIDDQAQELQRWWGFAKDGGIFSAAIDSDETYLGRVTVDSGSNASSITVDSAVGANRNSKLMLTVANGQAFEVAEVLSIAGSVITFKNKLLQNYPVGAQVRHSYYWPFVISTDMDFSPALINPKLKRWTAMINFKEAL